jgi:membrane protein DedA with SNARE-associated domain
MEHWITEMMNEFGYIGIFLLITLENVFPPIPSEVILTFGGFMTTQAGLSLWGVIFVSTLGSLFGAAILYRIGAFLDVRRLETLIGKYGRWLRLTNEDIQKANAWFQKYGIWTVFFCRFIPLIRSLISIPAGSTRMHFGTFIALTAIGSFIWNAVLIYVGAAVGASWETIVDYMDVYSNIAYAGLALAAALAVYWFLKNRFLKRR